MGDKNAPDEFWIVFQGAIDNWQEKVTKENGGIFWQPIRGKGALMRGHAIRLTCLRRVRWKWALCCERTVGRRMDAVDDEALESCGLKQNAGKLVIFPNLRRTVENRGFSRSKQEYQMKASHRFLGTVCPAVLSLGAEIDQRIWTTNRAWKELYEMWWDG